MTKPGSIFVEVVIVAEDAPDFGPYRWRKWSVKPFDGSTEYRRVDPVAASPAPPVEGATDLTREALKKAEQAIVDWGNLYAPEECLEETVAAAKERIREAGGTLGYLADALTPIRAALTAIGARDE